MDRKLQTTQQEDFLDYGEKVVKPGDVLHLPTVKTTLKEGDNKSYIVARVSFYLNLYCNKYFYISLHCIYKHILIIVSAIFGKRLVMHNRNTSNTTRICRLVI